MSDLIYKLEKTRADIEKLIEEHKRLIYYMLKEKNQQRNQDAESAAWEALWDAIGTFDVFSTNAFSTYACKIIGNAINDVLRKQNTVSRHIQSVTDELSTLDAGSTLDILDEDLSTRISPIFDEYICNCNGIKRNILLVWNASNFDVNTGNIAIVCNCSASYVSRVQEGFRGYLTTYLRKL